LAIGSLSPKSAIGMTASKICREAYHFTRLESVSKPSQQAGRQRCNTAPQEVEEIAEAVAKLPPDQLARFRRWFTAFEAGHTNPAEELDSAATKLGRLAGRAFAELKRRAKEP
jgi:hypothetical protein